MQEEANLHEQLTDHLNFISRFLFALTLTVSEILTIQIYDIQKVGHGYGVQFSQ